METMVPKRISFDDITLNARKTHISQRFKQHSFSNQKKLNDSSNCHCKPDIEEGKSSFIFALLLKSVEDSALVFSFSVLGLVAWSVVWAYLAQQMREHALQEPGGKMEQWVEDIENCISALRMIGTLFVFMLVFRFNSCYDRWWEARKLWGSLISKCLELNVMNRRWIKDKDLARRLSRFTIVFAYASKSLLRGRSLAEPNADGPRLVERGLLTQFELDDMHHHPSWQPYYCLEVICAIITEAHLDGDSCLIFPESNKIHGQLFRCFDNTLKKLNELIGDCIRIRSSSLPQSYDAVNLTTFFVYFGLASVVWGFEIGWMAPIIVFTASAISLVLIVMGTNLLTPFGYDWADLPLEAFCSTIETQINAIDERSKSGIIRRIAQTSTPEVRDGGETSTKSEVLLDTAGDSESTSSKS